jgi:hypothetical protein
MFSKASQSSLIGRHLLHASSDRKSRKRLAKANFAGKFTIALWGCGSGCIQMAVIDEENGAVYDGPFKTLSAGDFHTLKIYVPYLDFRANSRLAIVSGCREEDLSKCAAFYYKWMGARFLLLKNRRCDRSVWIFPRATSSRNRATRSSCNSAAAWAWGHRRTRDPNALRTYCTSLQCAACRSCCHPRS